MKINKTEQGITIISLVVTVIILLILAGVAIRSLSGDNGLISKTKQTVEESKKAEYQEGLDTIGLGVKLKTVGDNLSTVQYMDEYLEELNQEKTKEGSLFKESTIKRKNDETIRVETKEGYIYYVREDETIYVGKVGEVDEGNIAELRKADIIFSYSHNTWTNQDVEVTISLSETVQNKENYRLEYSKDNKNWSKYAEDTTITMTQNGKVYARTKDISGDIKLEGGYAEGEVTIIDKQAPTAGTLIMKLGSAEGEDYIEGNKVIGKVYIELVNGIDNEGGSGHKTTVYNVEGPESYTNQTEPRILSKMGTYTITVITTDNVNLNSTKQYSIEIEKITEGKNLDEIRDAINGKEETPTTLTIDGKEVVVPPGFTIAEDSGKTIPEGIVVLDPQKNEWVWVPCYVEGGKGDAVSGAIKYNRYNFGIQTGTYSNFSEVLQTEEKNSIKKYGGYYIGRYEASKDINDKVIIQKNKKPYQSGTERRPKCIELSEGMTSADGSDKDKLNGTKMFTKLCSSYSWDTAIIFIQKTHTSFATTSQTKDKTLAGNYGSGYPNYKGTIKDTGLTTPVCSIYDMGGNVWEYTTETGNYDTSPYVCRGGDSSCGVSETPPGFRANKEYQSNKGDGFRPTLFIK